ncbi:MAG TPA: adenylate/guanylate cyclase domain-containing protein [bacterium]|nr:adenylate/guanylate cyclase domain-containing protein [bacterium]
MINPVGASAATGALASVIGAVSQVPPILSQYIAGSLAADQARTRLAPVLSSLTDMNDLRDPVDRLRRFVGGADLPNDEARSILAGVEGFLRSQPPAADPAASIAQGAAEALGSIVGPATPPLSGPLHRPSVTLPPPSMPRTVRMLPAGQEDRIACGQCQTLNPNDYNFCRHCGIPNPETQKTPKPERKLVTMVFTDFKGFTEACETQEPEVIGEVRDRYRTALNAIIVAHQGEVVKWIGDAVMAVWGATRSSEDDAVNAVKAAWALQQEVSRINQELGQLGQPHFLMRVGVHTGKALVLYAQDPGRARELDLLGADVNRAARTEPMCKPGSVLCTDTTYRAVLNRGTFFEFEKRDFLKGKRAGEIKDRIATYEVMRPSLQDETQLGRHGSDIRFIGRGEELERIRRGFEETVAQARGRLLIVSGKAGYGKSRLGREFLAELDALETDAFRVRMQGEDIQVRLPFRAVAQALRAHIQIGADEDDASAAGKLRDFVKNARRNDETNGFETDAQLIGNLLGVAFEHRSDEVQFILQNPTELRVRTLEAVTKVLEGLSRQKPVVLVLEDLHWMDAASTQFLRELLERLADRPVFALGLARPDFFEESQALVDGPYPVDAVHLEPFSRGLQNEMLREILSVEIADNVREFLLTQSDGNPFLLQEMARALNEGWRVEKIQGRLQFVADNGETVPRNAQQFLQTRFDRLKPAQKEVLRQFAVAATGMTVLELLTLQTEVRPDEISEILDHLSGKGFLSRGENGLYQFSHALLREAVYDRIPQQEREPMHGAWAERLEDLREDEPDVIAYHYEKARRPLVASRFYYEAAEKIGFKDTPESIAFYRKAHELSAGEPDRQFKYLRGWDNILYLSGKYAEEDEVFRRSESLLGGLPEIDRVGHLCRVGRSLIRRRRFEEAAAPLTEALALLDTLPEDPVTVRLKGHILVERAINLVSLGKLDESEAMYTEAAEIGRSTNDPLVLGRALWSLSFRESRLGNAFGSFTAVREASELFREIGDFNRYVFTVTNVGWNLTMLGAYDEAEAVLQQALGLTTRFRSPVQGMESLNDSMGRVLYLKGSLDEAIAFFEMNLVQHPDHRFLVFNLAYLAQAHLAKGNIDLAQAKADEALRIALSKKSSPEDLQENEAAARVVRAQIQLKRGDPRGALFESAKAMEILEKLKGVETFGFEIPLIHAELLLLLGRHDEVETLIGRTCRDLIAKAQNIPDAVYRRHFLDIQVHRDLLQMARELGLDTGAVIP